jgi:hypothetical protein
VWSTHRGLSRSIRSWAAQRVIAIAPVFDERDIREGLSDGGGHRGDDTTSSGNFLFAFGPELSYGSDTKQLTTTG